MPYPKDSSDVITAARNGPPSRWPIVATLGVVLAAGVWAGLSMREHARRADRERCAANLRQIGTSILLYSVDKRNKYPDSFATLARFAFRDGPMDLARFVCPASGEGAPEADAADCGSYRLIADTAPMAIDIAKYGYSRSGSTTAEQCVAIEVPGHHADGVHVLHVDGSVQFREMSKTRGTTWAETQDDVMHNRPIRWPASQPVR